MTPEEAFEKEFVEYSRKNVKETGLWRPLSDKTFAEHFYLAATERSEVGLGSAPTHTASFRNYRSI